MKHISLKVKSIPVLGLILTVSLLYKSKKLSLQLFYEANKGVTMEMTILKDIVIIFALSTVVNFVFTKIRIPTIIGYLLTGIIAGPHLFAIIHAPHEIELMAEIGVVLLMFTIGLEFSLKHLLKIRRIVFFGGLMQLLLTAFITFFIALAYDVELKGAVFIGFLTALSSTAVVLKILQDRSELTSNYGRTVVGILIFQDIILIPLLLFTPILGGETAELGNQLFGLVIKTIFIVAFIYLGNKYFMPKLLHLIAHTRNQELFLMSILLICLAVALLTSEMGMSLAFGAFLAGLMISESEYSHNAFGHLIPFKDTFTSFFFVSIGMLLDLNFVINNILLVGSTVVLVIIIKTIIAGGTAFMLGHTFRGTVVVGMSLSQVGEFSFILAQIGIKHMLLSDFIYQIFLSVAIISMSITPLLIYVSHPLSNLMLKLPLPKFWVEGLFPLKQIEIPDIQNHIVFIGKDSRSLNLSKMAKIMHLPHVSIVFDPAIVQKMQQKGENVVYGDAINEPILKKAHTDTAEIVVISVGNLITAMAIIERVRHLNKHAYLIVRTRQVEDIEELYQLGANEVIPEEFETAIEIFQRVLNKLLVPKKDIDVTVAKIRDEHYGIFREKDETEEPDILSELPNLEVMALKIEDECSLIGKTLADVRFRKTYGVTLVAIKRYDDIIEHPEPETRLEKGDITYILGKPDQIAQASELFSKTSPVTSEDPE